MREHLNKISEISRISSMHVYTRDNERVENAIKHYPQCGKVISYTRITQGHINDTFRVDAENGVFLLQKVSAVAFKEPLKVMKNIVGVTRFLHDKIVEEGGDPMKGCLNLLVSSEGTPYWLNEKGQVWRMYYFVEGISFDTPKNPEMFGKAAEAFGRFQHLLEEFPANELEEVIPHFHDTPKRFAALEEAIAKDAMGRKKEVEDLIRIAYERKDRIHRIVDGLASGELPLRTTHNDTKLNNIMFDEKGEEPLCILDLDTIMPGSALYDFGDSIRFGANTCAEDERDTSKIHFNLEMFKAYAQGFIKGAEGSLTEKEIRLFPYSAWLLTFECGIRFLTDYLNGDVYFHIDCPDHNLVRAKDQFALFLDMERHQEDADRIIEELLK